MRINICSCTNRPKEKSCSPHFPLIELREHIFVTEQIVSEVNRNKLQMASRFFQQQMDSLRIPSIGCPDQLFTDDNLKSLRSRSKGLAQDVQEFERELEQVVLETLGRISRSQDEVSTALRIVFTDALSPNIEELRAAKERREFGTPPGKNSDPLGDQVSWEQFITNAIGKEPLWVITNDSDFITTFRGVSFLNPILYADLQSVCGELPDVRCFNNLMTGIQDFVETTGLRVHGLPTGEAAQRLEEELVANYYCGSLYLTHEHDDGADVIPLEFSNGLWACSKFPLVIRRNCVVVDGQVYPISSLRPFEARFVHKGEKFYITE